MSVNRVVGHLAPGGSLALVWREVVSWRQEPFEERLAQLSGNQWVKRMDQVDGSMQPIPGDPRFQDPLVLPTSLSGHLMPQLRRGDKDRRRQTD